MNLISHFEEYFHCHLAAFSGTIFSLLSGAAILQSIIVGVSVFIITNLIKFIWNKLNNKGTNK